MLVHFTRDHSRVLLKGLKTFLNHCFTQGFLGLIYKMWNKFPFHRELQIPECELRPKSFNKLRGVWIASFSRPHQAETISRYLTLSKWYFFSNTIQDLLYSYHFILCNLQTISCACVWLAFVEISYTQIASSSFRLIFEQTDKDINKFWKIPQYV